MKKSILTVSVALLALFILAGCGHSRKLGCPSVAQKTTQANPSKA